MASEAATAARLRALRDETTEQVAALDARIAAITEARAGANSDDGGP